MTADSILGMRARFAVAVTVAGALLSLALGMPAARAQQSPPGPAASAASPSPPVVVPPSPPAPPQIAVPRFDRPAYLAQRLAQFRGEDEHARPQPGGVLLIGSSTFEGWTHAARELAPLPVANRAISGSWTADQLAHVEALALQYRPRAILYYCGSNDLADGQAPVTVATNILAFADRVNQALPEAEIFFVSIIHAPARRAHWPAFDEVNALMRAAAAIRPRFRYLDVIPAVESAPFAPREALFRPDRLHLLPTTYPALAAIIRPALTPLFPEAGVTAALASQPSPSSRPAALSQE